MKYKSLLILIISFQTAVVSAKACELSHILNFSVYTSGSMTVSHSDFQGLTGAGGMIRASHFMFGPIRSAECGISVSSHGGFYGQNGEIKGYLELTSKKAYYGISMANGYANFKSTARRSNFVDHKMITQHMHELSDHLRSLPISNDASAFQTPGELIIQLGQGNVQVLKIDSALFSSRGTLRILGRSDQTLVLNISGKDIYFVSKKINVGGLYIRNIFINFYEAEKLFMSKIGGFNSTYQAPFDGYDTSLGLQGFIFAPHAATDFSNMKITGGLYTRDIIFSSGPTGQVNVAPMQMTTNSNGHW